jgi:DNA-directed RNA polymerase subunit RPC12/RpoP
MCRYAFYKYKTTYGCFKCQVGFKRPNLFDVDKNATESKDFNCPNCGSEMYNLGRDLRLPSKEKDEQWACIKYLVDHQYNIYSCGCQGIGFVPHKMEDAIELVKNVAINRKKYIYEEALLEKKKTLETNRKKRKDALRTRLLLREVKNENNDQARNKKD